MDKEMIDFAKHAMPILRQTSDVGLHAVANWMQIALDEIEHPPEKEPVGVVVDDIKSRISVDWMKPVWGGQKLYVQEDV